MLRNHWVQKALLHQIKRATDSEIYAIMRAIEERYAQAFPDWEVIYMAVHKEPHQRDKDIRAIIDMLKIEKMDSLG